MSMQNFAIVFGPTLFGPGANGVVADPTYQNLVSLLFRRLRFHRFQFTYILYRPLKRF